MKVIGFEDIKALQISPAQCYAWVSEMIGKKGMTVLPPKVHMNLPENIFCNVMPSILKLPDAGGGRHKGRDALSGKDAGPGQQDPSV